MGLKRFQRQTNGFSKKARNHCAAVALHIAHYNLCRVHSTLRTTPLVALGVTDHVWSIAELVDAACSIAPDDPPAPPPILAPSMLLPPHEAEQLPLFAV